MLWAVVAVCILTVPLARGSLTAFADLHSRLRRRWALFAALGVQVAILKLWPHGASGVHQVLYLASYGLGGIFVWSNRKIPGLWLIALGGLSNFAAIAANGGIMPGAPAAFAAAHLAAAPSVFVNSRAVVDPRLAFLGDIFAVPGWLPFHNVFSIGDICIVIGCFIGLHRISGSRLLPNGSGQFGDALKEPSFRRLWLAQAISNQGDWIYSMAVVTRVVGIGGAAHTLALLVIMQAAPRAVASALGGPLVDRMNRKALMVFTDVVRAAAVASLLFQSHPSIAHLYLVAACLGLFGAIFQPSLQASIPNVVAPERLVAANALVSVTFQAAVMIGPMLGAALVLTLGLGPAFGVNAASFVVSAALVSGVRLPSRPREQKPEPAVRALVEGGRYALSNRTVRGILLVTGLVMFAAANRSPLEPLLILRTLHSGPASLGLATAVWGLGMLLGSTAAPAASRRWSCERLLGVSIAVVGLAVLGASQVAAVSSLFGLWLFAGSGNAVGTISYQSLLQAKTPDALRGRIVAASEMVLDIAYLAGVTLAGYLGTHAGVRVAFATSGAVFLVAAVTSQVVLGPRRRAGRAAGPPVRLMAEAKLVVVPWTDATAAVAPVAGRVLHDAAASDAPMGIAVPVEGETASRWTGIAARPFPMASPGLAEPAVRSFLDTLGDELEALRRREQWLRARLDEWEDAAAAQWVAAPPPVTSVPATPTARTGVEHRPASELFARIRAELAESGPKDAASAS